MNRPPPSAVFVGCARDVAPHLDGTLRNLDNFSAVFGRSAFVFAENDSTDDTPARLKQWLEQGREGWMLRADGLAARQPLRTQRIAVARNACLDHIARSPWQEFDFLVVMDLDEVNASPISGTAFADAVEFLQAHPDYAALFACSDPFYYDVWALRHPSWCPDDCWAEVRANRDLSHAHAVEHFVYSRQLSISPTTLPIPVNSAFGGLGIYRLDAALAGRYVGLTSTGVECCEHVAFNASVASRGRLAIFPTLRNVAPPAHGRPRAVGEVRNLRVTQSGKSVELRAPADHAFDRMRAAFPLYQRWLPELARLLGEFAPEASIVEIGADIGIMAAACRLAGCAARFFAVEPLVPSFGLLESNVANHSHLMYDVHPLRCFISPPLCSDKLANARSARWPAGAEGEGAEPPWGGPPVRSLNEVVEWRMSLLKLGFDDCDGRFLDANSGFIERVRPAIWTETHVSHAGGAKLWAALLARLSSRYPLLCVFDNFGFPVVAGSLDEKLPFVVELIDYVARRRAVPPEVAGEPRIFHLELALFPEHFRAVHRDFVSMLKIAHE